MDYGEVELALAAHFGGQALEDSSVDSILHELAHWFSLPCWQEEEMPDNLKDLSYLVDNQLRWPPYTAVGATSLVWWQYGRELTAVAVHERVADDDISDWYEIQAGVFSNLLRPLPGSRYELVGRVEEDVQRIATRRPVLEAAQRLEDWLQEVLEVAAWQAATSRLLAEFYAVTEYQLPDDGVQLVFKFVPEQVW